MCVLWNQDIEEKMCVDIRVGTSDWKNIMLKSREIPGGLFISPNEHIWSLME